MSSPDSSALVANDMKADSQHLSVSGSVGSGLKSSGSRVDLSSTVRGAAFASAGTVSRKEYYWNLFCEHKHSTVTLCLVFWSFGMCVAFLGPTLLDLGCKTGTVFATMSWVFFSQTFFILLGSACGGLVLRRCSADVILLIGITMMTLTMATIPLCNALWGLALVLAVMGFFMGIIDTVANVTMITLYEKDVSPFLQAIHFFYGVGAFVSPMIAQPFLLNEDCSIFISNSTQVILEFEQEVGDLNESMPATTLEEARRMTRIDYAFLIMALLMVPVLILALSLVIRRCVSGSLDVTSGGSTKQSDYETMAGAPAPGCNDLEIREESRRPTCSVAIVTVLTALLMFLYDGLQAAYGGYIYSYAVKGPVRLHKTDAAYLNALFWGMFATGRLLSIALATKLTPAFMLFCNIMGCTLGLLLMLSMRYSYVMLIIGTCMMGIFMSSVFPTALSLTEQYIHVTPTTTSFLVFGAAVGEMSIPVCVGHEFFLNGPTSFLVIGMVLCFLSIIAYMSLWLAGLTIVKPDSTSDLVVWFSKCMPGKLSEGESSALANQNIQYYSRMPGGSPEATSPTVSFMKREPDGAE